MGMLLLGTGKNTRTDAVSLVRSLGGALYVPAISAMFEEISGSTTPATSGDPVGEIRDATGVFPALFAPSLGARPEVGSGGGLTWFETDGVDDRLVASAFAVSQPATIVVVTSVESVAGPSYYFDGLAYVGDRMALGIGILDADTGKHQIFATGTGVSYAQSIPTGVREWACIFDGASSSIRRDGVQVATGDAGSAGITGLTIGRGIAGDGPIACRYYAVALIPSHVSGANLATLTTLLGAYGGLSL